MRPCLAPLSLIVARLDEDPFEIMEVSRDFNFDNIKPRKSFLKEDKRDDVDDRAYGYDAPRIRYFRDLFLAKKHVTAIQLQMFDEGSLSLFNGYHRLCGAILAEVKEVRVEVMLWHDDPTGIISMGKHIDSFYREVRKHERSHGNQSRVSSEKRANPKRSHRKAA